MDGATVSRAGTSAALAGRRAVVIGSGITGLAAALILAKRRAAVTIIERDAEPEATTPEDAFRSWQRRGAPQVRHSHAFLGRLRNLLRDRHPQLLHELLAAGARELRMIDAPPLTLGTLTPEPGDGDMVAIGCRRTTFEWIVRRHVLSRPDVTLISGAEVKGLLAAPVKPPVVSGVRFAIDGAEQRVDADIVIDASGRRSKAVQWLAEIGAQRPFEKEESSGVIYYTRFYRLLPGAIEPPRTSDPTVADHIWIKFAVFPADDRTFSITLAIPLAEPRLKVLARAEAFDTMVRFMPGLVPWVDPKIAEPIGDPAHPVQAMGGLINRLRRFVDERGPLARGFFVLGDAAYCTNPLYGRGCAQGFLHAELLGEALEGHCGDLDAAALALDRAARDQIEPFYRASVEADREAVRKAEGRTLPRRVERLRERFFEDGIAVATRCDPVVFRAFVRMFNMLETPERAFGRADVVLRSLWVWSRGKWYNRRYAVPEGPDRESTIARCEAALAAPAHL